MPNAPSARLALHLSESSIGEREGGDDYGQLVRTAEGAVTRGMGTV